MSPIPFFHAAAVSQDLSKPIVATDAFAAGQVIFQEDAIVSSNYGNLDDCGCHHHHDEHGELIEGDCGASSDEPETLDEDDLETVSPAVVEAFDALMVFCDDHAVLSMVDIRKNLFKLLRLYELDPSSLTLLLTMTINQDESHDYLDAAVGLRAAHASVVPAGLSDDAVAHLIGVLNNKYCHALEEIQGSGVFVYMSILTHSCVPNCNLTTTGHTMWLTATRPIAAHEALTVDLANLFYRPQKERLELLENDKVVCACDLCTDALPDYARAFKCHACTDGIVHPKANVFSCTTCHVVWGADDVTAIEAEERRLVETLDATSLDALDDVIAASRLHRFHFIFFWALDDLNSICVEEEFDDAALAKIYRRILDCLNYTLPYPHDEKVQHYDHLAQTLISIGDVAGAKDAYEHAYALSCLCSGKDYDESQLYHRLMTNTPTNKEEMLKAYGLEDGDMQAPAA
ncbi:Aste57867_12077 [Aphanomyces stellatus]|uniref:Aste57867_12077 protein n=1 Tax=Aphanomyces stellatus TaxID=120398 RepID=A0A485KUN1_9STRA|nr:hypothetical protein As57867_012032 [Aphanomyces stellatus]VFT88932.1 Aste57867_12077 [Aphanomyces stellatus]